MCFITGKNMPSFAKDTVYRFMKMTFLPVNSILLSSENMKNRINEANTVDKRTVGYKRRQLSMKKGTTAMLELLKAAKTAEIPAKVVYVRKRNKRKEYLCLVSTDTSLSEEEIIRIYGKRWDTEMFFKICKSYLNLSKECNSNSIEVKIESSLGIL